MRLILITAALALMLAGCTITPRSRVLDHRYPPPPSYGWHDHTRIIYIKYVPYYVDEYRRAWPVPAHLRHKYKYSEANRTPPAFGRDMGKRDGYELSRIVYIDDVPYYVTNERHASPLPPEKRERFKYSSVSSGDGRPENVRPAQSVKERDQSDGQRNGRDEYRDAPGRSPDEAARGFSKSNRLEERPSSQQAHERDKNRDYAPPVSQPGNQRQETPSGRGNVRDETRGRPAADDGRGRSGEDNSGGSEKKPGKNKDQPDETDESSEQESDAQGGHGKRNR